MIIMGEGTIFIQPHSDDMVMSSYYILKSGVLPKPYYLLTIFSRSTWIDPIKRKQLFHKAVRDVEVTRLRTAEDRRFCKLLDLKPLFFNYEDCMLRTGKTILSPKKTIDNNLLKSITAQIAGIVRDYCIQNMLTHFPSGLQQHLDHRFVLKAANLVRMSLPINVYLVDDIPYSHVSDLKRKGLRVLDEIKVVDLAEKFRAMDIYASQVCNLFFSQVKRLTDENRGFERLMAFN